MEIPGENMLHSLLADGGLGRDAPQDYLTVTQGIFTLADLPEDTYISEVVASLNRINAGATTTVDTSQVTHLPAHTDACITGLQESGRRALFAYSAESVRAVGYRRTLPDYLPVFLRG
jgi:hypothetical protein